MLRTIDKVSTEYRDLVVLMLKQGDCESKFVLEDLEKVSENWDDIYIWLLLRTICSDDWEMKESMKEEYFGITEKMKKSLGGAWNYILENKYMQNAGSVLKYENKYYDDMDKGVGIAYEKRERILTYIENGRDNVLRREHLQNCWMRYVSEIFKLFRDIEEEQYRVMEGLADWDAIEKEIYGRGEGETDDANN